MVVALTSEDGIFLENKDAGTCTRFWIYTIKNNQIITKKNSVIPEGKTLESYLSNSLDDFLYFDDLQVNIFLSKEITTHLASRLKKRKVKAFIVDELEVNEILSQLIEGKLKGYIPEEHNCNCGVSSL